MRTKAVAGIMVTLFLTAMFLTAIPVKADPDTLVVGIIGPVGLPHYSPAGMKEAAEMARDEINAAGGGINFNDTTVDIELKFGNEYALPVPDPDAARLEVRRLIDVEGCDIIIGGFRTEVTGPMIEEAMTSDTPFLINGAATTGLIGDTVGVDPGTYKYLFRVMPTNDSMLLFAIASFIKNQSAKLNEIYGDPLKYAVLTEDLAWTVTLHIALTDPEKYHNILGTNVECVYQGRIPETATDMSTYLQAVDASGAKLVFHVFSGRAGIPLIVQWKERECKAIPFGINVLAQMQDHWSNTLGKCEYEGGLVTTGTATPLTPQMVVFWEDFVARTGKWPIYTAIGAYNGLKGLEALGESGVLNWSVGADIFTDPNDFVSAFESAEPREVLNGMFQFTSDPSHPHDVFIPYPLWALPYDHVWTKPLAAQWQVVPPEEEPNRMEAILPINAKYTQKWKLLPWTYPAGYESLAETDTVAYIDDVSAIDATVNILDQGYITRAWGTNENMSQGSTPGKWNYNADLSGDNYISIVDAVLLAKDWQKAVPGSYPL